MWGLSTMTSRLCKTKIFPSPTRRGWRRRAFWLALVLVVILGGLSTCRFILFHVSCSPYCHDCWWIDGKLFTGKPLMSVFARERERDSVHVWYVRDWGNDNRFFVSMCVEDRERHVHGALCCVTWRHIYIIREWVCEIHMRTWGEMRIQINGCLCVFVCVCACVCVWEGVYVCGVERPIMM